MAQPPAPPAAAAGGPAPGGPAPLPGFPAGPIDIATLQQLSAVMGNNNNQKGFRKVRPFSSGDGPAFIAWKAIFAIDCRVNGWGQDQMRMKQELRGAMQPPASTAISDIDYETPISLNDMMEQYMGRFMPAAASRLAKTYFLTALQAEEESLLNWFGRIRELFQRAYPAVLDSNADENLIDRFILGMAQIGRAHV